MMQDIQIKINKLTQELAKQSYFGVEIMRRSNTFTNGTRHRALNRDALAALKDFVRKNVVPALGEQDWEQKWAIAANSLDHHMKNMRKNMIGQCSASQLKALSQSQMPYNF